MTRKDKDALGECGMMVMTSVVRFEDGAYVGDVEWAKNLAERGIKPELIDQDHKVCSVGFCESEQKWYGWSHRAMYGFGIGEIVDAGDEGAEYFDSLPFVCETLADCRVAAANFARAVG